MKYVNADITEAPEPVIIHGCNAQGKMNSGVAKALRHKYPSIYRDYMVDFDDGLVVPGAVVVSAVDNKIIGNLITQEFYGYDGTAYASVSHIWDSLGEFMFALKYQFQFDPMPNIATPKIGCGRGGLDWEEVKKIFEQFEEKYKTEFVVYDIPDGYSK